MNLGFRRKLFVSVLCCQAVCAGASRPHGLHSASVIMDGEQEDGVLLENVKETLGLKTKDSL